MTTMRSQRHPPLPHPLLKGEGIFWNSWSSPLSIRERVTRPFAEGKSRMRGMQGFSQLLLIGLIAAGIIAGTLLVQNGVSFMPHAEEQEPLHPSKDATKKCTDEADPAQCKIDNDKTCAADTVTYCDNRQGSPRAIRKSGGYYDPSNSNAEESGCVFDYREVTSKDSECGKSESKSGDVVYTTVSEAKQLDSDKTSLGQRSVSSGPTGSGSADDSVACLPSTTNTFKDEKVAENLARFYAILDGEPKLCTPSDLGVEPRETADAEGGGNGRLLLCTDSDGKSVWKVIIDKDLKNPKSKPAPGDRDSLIKGFTETGRLPKARTTAGLQP